MIRNRPKTHFSLPYYEGLPPAPYQLDMSAIPELIKLSLLPLRRIEPLGLDALHLIDGFVEDLAGHTELQYYEGLKAEFQIEFIVINSIYSKKTELISTLLPYSMSLIPASKRGRVESVTAQSVSRLQEAKLFEDGAAYMGLDPFSGEWSFFSQAGLIADLGAQTAMTDELGLVYDYFFLRKGCDFESITQAVSIDMPERRLTRYLRHRAKLLYTPFEKVEARQIWGVENALELFVYQEFIRQGLPRSIPQAMLFSDGSYQPALYHVWEAFESGADADFITECDFYFPEVRIAVFCDGATHSRTRIRERDLRIDNSLLNLGIKPIRITSRKILRDIERAVSAVVEAM